MDTEQVQNLDTNNITSEIKNQENQQNVDMIIDLPKLSLQSDYNKFRYNISYF